MRIKFEGSLGGLIEKLRPAADTNSRLYLKKFSIAPEGIRWENYPIPIPKELVDIFPEISDYGYLSFYEKISRLQKLYRLLYADQSIPEKSLIKFREAARSLCHELKKIRKNLRLEKHEGGIDIKNEELEEAIKKFNDGLPEIAKKFRIEANNEAIGWFDFRFPLTIEELDKLVGFTEFILHGLRPQVRRGRMPEPFSVLMFYIIDDFTFYVYKKNQKSSRPEIVKKRGRVRLQKNWNLIIAAILWLMVLEGIEDSKLECFIEDHEKEKADEAIRKLQSWIERQYSHFRASGKGRGKWGGHFRMETDSLDYWPAYIMPVLKTAGQPKRGANL
ncbi:MAG: hypothetical protein QME69_02755 [Candidatus Saccharicenans sp.]|nr:hypothetical protein [Candidatus Saccharicenans sp.]